MRIGACEVACPAMPHERDPGPKHTLDISMRDPEQGAKRSDSNAAALGGWAFWISSTRCEDSELAGAIRGAKMFVDGL